MMNQSMYQLSWYMIWLLGVSMAGAGYFLVGAGLVWHDLMAFLMGTAVTWLGVLLAYFTAPYTETHQNQK